MELHNKHSAFKINDYYSFLKISRKANSIGYIHANSLLFSAFELRILKPPLADISLIQ